MLSVVLIEWNFWTCLSLRDAASIIYQLYCMFGILFKVFQPKKKVGWKMRKSRINKMCLIVEAGWWVQEDSISIKKREERRHTKNRFNCSKPILTQNSILLLALIVWTLETVFCIPWGVYCWLLQSTHPNWAETFTPVPTLAPNKRSI